MSCGIARKEVKVLGRGYDCLRQYCYTGDLRYVKWIAVFFALPFILLTGGLLLNSPPLFAPPGPATRLKTYLRTNIAETRPDHPFAELRTPHFPADKQATHAAVLASMRSLGWKEIVDEGNELRAVVVSPLLRFKDDVTVSLEPTTDGTLLHARSASRRGRGDLAANARHLQALFAAIRSFVTARHSG